MMRIIPVDLPQLEVGPVLDSAFREPERASARLDELHECLDAIEQPHGGIGSDRDAASRKVDPVRLIGDGFLVPILRGADGYRTGCNLEAQHAAQGSARA